MLTDRHGKGIRVDAVEDVFSASALHYTTQDLYKETHDCNLKPRPEVILSLDAAVLGLGNSSCGPGVLKKMPLIRRNIPCIYGFVMRNRSRHSAEQDFPSAYYFYRHYYLN